MSTVKISMIAETRALREGVTEVNSRLGKLGETAGKAGSLLKGAIAGAALFYGASKVTEFFKSSIEAGRESNKVSAQTAAVLKSTGGAAGITAKQIEGLAQSIARKTGVDDDQIQSNENLLLTFTNIRNEVGKGNDIFNQATQTVSDMSAALGQSGKAGAIQLGKALNDPIKGITALSRVGVAFTAQQKAQITTLTNNGHALAAQKIILGELSKEFGGSAAAIATPSQKLHVIFHEIEESVGKALIPLLDKLATYLVKKLPGWIDTVHEKFAEVKVFLKPVFLLLGDLIKRFEGLKQSKNILLGVGIALAAIAAPAVVATAAAIAIGVELDHLFNTNQKFHDEVINDWNEIKDVAQDVWPNIQQVVSSAIGIITETTKDELAVLEFIWKHFGDTLTTFVRKTFENDLTIIRGAFEAIAGVFKLFDDLIHGRWSKLWGDVKQILRGAMTVIKGVVAQGFNILKTTVHVALIALVIIVKAAFKGIIAIIKAAITADINIIASMPGRIIALGGKFLSAGKTVGSKVIDGIRSGLSAVGGLAGSIVSGVGSALTSLINHLIDQMNSAIPNHLGIGKLGINLPASPIPHVALANGGIVTKPTIALIGEAGPEAVIPLSRKNRAGNTYVYINTGAVLSTDEDLGAWVVQKISAAQDAGMVAFA